MRRTAWTDEDTTEAYPRGGPARHPPVQLARDSQRRPGTPEPARGLLCSRRMRRSPARSPAVALALALGGCSLVLPFDSYTDGNGDGAVDAAPTPPREGGASSSGSGGDASPDVPDAADTDGSACGDLLSTSNHCGSCDHDCLGDACVNGTCAATAITTTAAGGYGIDVDAQNVYWSVSYGDAAGGQLRKIGKNDLGGTSVTLLDSPHVRFEPLDVKVDGSYVVVVDGSPGNGTAAVYRVPTAGGSAAGVGACALDGVSGLAITPTDFYFVSNRLGPDTSVYRAAKSGASCATHVGEGWPGLRQIAFDQGVLYLTQPAPSSAPDGSLFALPVGSSTPTPIAADRVTDAWTVLPDGDSLLVTTEGGAVLRVSKDGSTITPLSREVEALPRGLVADDTHVYWSNFGSGEIVSYERRSGMRRVLASGQTNVQLLASDATHLYWTSPTHVMRLRK